MPKGKCWLGFNAPKTNHSSNDHNLLIKGYQNHVAEPLFVALKPWHTLKCPKAPRSSCSLLCKCTHDACWGPISWADDLLGLILTEQGSTHPHTHTTAEHKATTHIGADNAINIPKSLKISCTWKKNLTTWRLALWFPVALCAADALSLSLRVCAHWRGSLRNERLTTLLSPPEYTKCPTSTLPDNNVPPHFIHSHAPPLLFQTEQHSSSSSSHDPMPARARLKSHHYRSTTHHHHHHQWYGIAFFTNSQKRCK